MPTDDAPADRTFTLTCDVCGPMPVSASALRFSLRCPACRKRDWPNGVSLRGPDAPPLPRAKPAKPEQAAMPLDDAA